MAPQSTISKGPSLRSEWSCSARAATSLPVPVGPSIKTGASASAKRCRRPKTIFMASERPCSPPKRGIGAYGISASASVAASDRTVRPMRTLLPGSTRASSTSAEPTCTPLREPRLRICTPPSTSDSSACIQLTLPSVSTSPHAGARPTRIGLSPSSTTVPRSGPCTTSTRTLRRFTVSGFLSSPRFSVATTMRSEVAAFMSPQRSARSGPPRL